MSLRDTCDIVGLKLSARSLNALKMIDIKVGLANHLSRAISVSPLLEIFGGGMSSISGTAKNIYTYHWDDFGRAMGAVPPALRKIVHDIATQEALFSHGKEGEFWKCIVNTVR